MLLFVVVLTDPLKVLRPGTNRTSADEFIVWATFHQSYAYEDFVEGIRPRENEDGEIRYPVVPGVFRHICDRAAVDKDNKYVLVIDEINRGNIAKVFGELITLIEDDKRGKLPIFLPYSGFKFMVPENLYLIGTMNTADRSIASSCPKSPPLIAERPEFGRKLSNAILPGGVFGQKLAILDIALRRRFAFMEILSKPALLAGVSLETDEAIVELDKLLVALNSRIASELGSDYQIGHSYFLKVKDAEPTKRQAQLEFVWNRQILPLLHEYFYSQPEKLAELLQPFQSDDLANAVHGISGNLGQAAGDVLIEKLAELAG